MTDLTLPYSLSDGQKAFAARLMANFNALLQQLNNGAAAVEVAAIEGASGLTVQAVLESLTDLIKACYTASQADALIIQETYDLVQSVNMDLATGVLTVSKKDGSTQSWDTALEKVPASFALTQADGIWRLVVTNVDGSSSSTDVTNLMNVYNFTAGATVAFSQSGTGNVKTVSAEVRDGSLGVEKLALSALSALDGYTQAAASSAGEAEAASAAALNSANNSAAAADAALGSKNEAAAQAALAAGSAAAADSSVTSAESALTAAVGSADEAELSAAAAAAEASDAAAMAALSESYAKGGTGMRDNESTDNAKYYMEQAASVVGADFLTKTGEGQNLSVSFTEAALKENLVSGENLGLLCGKLKKWFSSLGGAAWLNVGSAANTLAAGDHHHNTAYAPLSHSHNYLATAQKGAAGGVAELDSAGKVPSAQLPSFVDDVLEYAAKVNFPAVGEAGKIYLDLATNLAWRWSGTVYVEISPSLALGETAATAYRGDRGAAAYSHLFNSTVHITAAERASWNSPVPAGIIALWSGAIVNIPAGWALCDGSNGTPNLRDRFVVGAGNEYAVGAGGGEKTHILTVDEMPSHNHTVYGSVKGMSGTIKCPLVSSMQADGNYTTLNSGNGAAHENRPPYYALAYIMKL